MYFFRKYEKNANTLFIATVVQRTTTLRFYSNHIQIIILFLYFNSTIISSIYSFNVCSQ